MTSDRKSMGDTNAPNTRELLDAYFDGEIDRAGKGRLHEALRHDHVLAEEFSRTNEAVSMLRQSASNSGLEVDLTQRVLARCESRRGYLNKRGRRFVLAGRSAVALAALALTAGVVLWVRLTPAELRLPDSQRPLGVLLESGNADAAKMRMVPPNVQQDLADSVDQSKAERTIVFHLQADPAESFSLMGVHPESPADARAMSRLPMFARSDNPQKQRAMTMRLGPLPMDDQQSASVVRTPESGAAGTVNGWWGRPGFEADVLMHPNPGRGAWLIMRRSQPEHGGLFQADRDRE